MLAPFALFMMRCSRRVRLRAGLLLAALSVTALLSIVVYQRIHWWPAASDWQRSFFRQRCAFRIATTVEIPIVQTLAFGIVAIFPSPKRIRATKSSLTVQDDCSLARKDVASLSEE